MKMRKAMKILSAIVIVSFTFVSVLLGCSKEEDHQVVSKPPKVVKHIIKPQPKRVVQEAKQKKEQAAQAPKPGLELSVASVEQKTLPSKKVQEKKQARAETHEPGQYIVKKDETLSSIARRKDVYGDPLKWSIICLSNLEKLADLASGEDFPHRELPEGIKLKIISRVSAKESIAKSTPKYWVVNVLSAKTERDIIAHALKLLKKGYPVYITSTQVKGKQWIRLRVGFFKTKKEADAVGKDIQRVLNFGQTWSTKAKREEFEEFAGLLSQGKDP